MCPFRRARAAPLNLAGLALAVVASASLPATTRATPNVPDDKSGYHLFHPTPAPLLRDLSTDRPDITESPHTVDAGRFQLELEVASFSEDESPSGRAESVGILGVNAKAGLLPSVDLQLVAGFVRQDFAGDSPGLDEEASGLTDLTVRLKWNLWGNDQGATALALMPFVTLPTGADGLTSDAVEGGLIAPFGFSLPAEFNMGLMAEADWIHDADGSGHHLEWLTTATLGRGLLGALGAFVEIAASFRDPDEGDWVGTADAGLTYGFTPNIQLDAGVFLGLSEDADGGTFFLGLSLRR